MTQDDFFQVLQSELKLMSLSTKERQEIKDYLYGQTDTFSVQPRNFNMYSDIFGIMYKELKIDNPVMAKRAYHVASKLVPNQMAYQLDYRDDRYQLFKQIELEEDYIKLDIIESFNQDAKNYGNFLFTKLNNFCKYLRNVDNGRHVWSLLFQNYPEIVKKIIDEFDPKDAKEWMAKDILTILSLLWYQKEPEEKEKYLDIVEKNVYSILKKIYSLENIKSDIDEYIQDEQAKELLTSIKPSAIFYDREILKGTYLSIMPHIYQISPLLSQAYKILLIEEDSRELIRKYCFSIEKIKSFYTYFQLPLRFTLMLLAKSAIEREDNVSQSKCIAELEEYFHQNEDIFYALTQETLDKKQLESIIFVGILNKFQKSTSHQIQKAEDILLARLSNLMNNSKQVNRHCFSIVVNNVNLENLDELKNPQFPLEDAQFFNDYYHISDIGQVAACASILYHTSIAARNLVYLLLFHPYPYAYWGSAIEIFLKYHKAFFDNTHNPFVCLSEVLGTKSVIRIYNRYGQSEKGQFIALLKDNIEITIQALKDMIKEGDTNVTRFIPLLYAENMGISYKEIVPALNQGSKTIIDFAEEFLLDKGDYVRQEVELLTKSKNKNTRAAATRLIKAWDSEKIMSDITQINSTQQLVQFITTQYNKANETLIPNKTLIDFTQVRYANSDEFADPIIVKYYIIEYMLLKELHIIKSCEKIKVFLNLSDLKKVLTNLFEAWLENKADTKQKNILLPYALNCTAGEIPVLKKQIDKWAENSRGALAAFAVTALALNGSNMALMLTEEISRKYKNKQVKNSAALAMEKAANSLGITKEELGDKIIPNLGFDKTKKKYFDYGNRKFIAILNDKLDITLTTEAGKVIKSLPKANANDDEQLVQAAKEELKGLKKQLKAIVTTQKGRLENAFMLGRSWISSQWKELFIENPIMNCFAIGLIWKEMDQDKKLLGTFRYMEDGTFNSAEEEEYELSENSEIILLHPLDIEKASLEQWRQQLEDYEITQPINQLNIPFFTLTPKELEDTEISRFALKKVYFGTVRGVMEKYSWNRTSIIDGGGYDGYYYEDEASKIGVQMQFEYLYVGMQSEEITTMQNLTFYKSGSIKYGSYFYDEIDSNKQVLPKDVPAKLLNFALMVADAIAQKEIH